MTRQVRIKWDGQRVSGRWFRPTTPSKPAVLLAHGAGAGQDHPGMAVLREGLAARGHPVLTFNYPYMEQGRKAPDRPAKLLECHKAAADWLRSRFDSIVLAGRSMGGRMATHLAADGEPCAGLVLFSYPLHPPGRPERLRVEHLSAIAAPMLFFVGSRDSFARPDLVERYLVPLPGAEVEVIPDADHGMKVPKRSSLTTEDVNNRLLDRTSNWIDQLPT